MEVHGVVPSFAFISAELLQPTPQCLIGKDSADTEVLSKHFPTSPGFLLLISDRTEKLFQLRVSQEIILPLTLLTCGVDTMPIGPSSNIGGGGGGGEGKVSSGAGGKGSSKGGGGGGKAQFEEKLISSPGGGGGGSGRSIVKNENKSRFHSFLTLSLYKPYKES